MKGKFVGNNAKGWILKRVLQENKALQISEKRTFLTRMPYYRRNVQNLDAHSEPSETSRMEVFAKMVSNWMLLTIFIKSSMLDVWLGSEYACKSQLKLSSMISCHDLLIRFDIQGPISYFHTSQRKTSNTLIYSVYKKNKFTLIVLVAYVLIQFPSNWNRKAC